MKTVVVAFGGNAITREAEAGTHAEQWANTAEMARVVRRAIKLGYRVLVTHGNGPQVGSLAIQQEEGARLVPAQPLFALGAMTQGGIAHLLGLALVNALGNGGARIASVVTHVLVDRADPAFRHPTKPIGPFFPKSRAQRLARERGWSVREDAGRGWRRVVASPEPRSILEADAIRALMDAGFVVIAAGGGGIPVVRRGGRLEGVEGVIDKDLSAERLATAVGAEALLMLTGVDRVAVDFGTPKQRWLTELPVEEAERYLAEGQFPAGSMGPKVTAAIRFLHAGGHVAIITTPRRAGDALAGRHGTRLVADRAQRAETAT